MPTPTLTRTSPFEIPTVIPQTSLKNFQVRTQKARKLAKSFKVKSLLNRRVLKRMIMSMNTVAGEAFVDDIWTKTQNLYDPDADHTQVGVPDYMPQDEPEKDESADEQPPTKIENGKEIAEGIQSRAEKWLENYNKQREVRDATPKGPAPPSLRPSTNSQNPTANVKLVRDPLTGNWHQEISLPRHSGPKELDIKSDAKAQKSDGKSKVDSSHDDTSHQKLNIDPGAKPDIKTDTVRANDALVVVQPAANIDNPSGVKREVGKEEDKPAQFLETGSRQYDEAKDDAGDQSRKASNTSDGGAKSGNNSDGGAKLGNNSDGGAKLGNNSDGGTQFGDNGGRNTQNSKTNRSKTNRSKTNRSKTNRSQTKDNNASPRRRRLRGRLNKLMGVYGQFERDYRDRQMQLNKQIRNLFPEDTMLVLDKDADETTNQEN